MSSFCYAHSPTGTKAGHLPLPENTLGLVCMLPLPPSPSPNLALLHIWASSKVKLPPLRGSVKESVCSFLAVMISSR